MLERLDLAYAINVHVAQGMTAEHGIVVMSSRERMLSSARSFLVAMTRVADKVTLVVDSAPKLERAVLRNPGDKSSALETVGELPGAAGLAAGRDDAGLEGRENRSQASNGAIGRDAREQGAGTRRKSSAEIVSRAMEAVAHAMASAADAMSRGSAGIVLEGPSGRGKGPVAARASAQESAGKAADVDGGSAARPELEKTIDEAGGRARDFEIEM